MHRSSGKVQCSSVGCKLAQLKDIRLWRPGFGPEGKHFVSGNSLFFIFGGAAKLRRGGRAAPVWRVYEPKKTGARSARARTRGQNPLVLQNSLSIEKKKKNNPSLTSMIPIDRLIRGSLIYVINNRAEYVSPVLHFTEASSSEM